MAPAVSIWLRRLVIQRPVALASRPQGEGIQSQQTENYDEQKNEVGGLHVEKLRIEGAVAVLSTSS
jgi:hypothetical protein